MKITKARLKQIIKEERDAYLPQMGAGISPKEGAAELRKDMEELMGSILFSKADPKDKRNAAKKIYSALIRTSFYGGENRFYEEILDDALGGYGSDLQQRLADAAGAPVDSWGEALSAWASGEEDFESYADPDYEDEDIGYMQENQMKISKARLRQIIKEEIEKIEEESDPAVTEFELYSDLLEITKQLDEFSSNLNVAMGLTASATKQSQLPDEVYETIRSAIRGLDDARIKMAQAIGQDPAPELAAVR